MRIPINSGASRSDLGRQDPNRLNRRTETENERIQNSHSQLHPRVLHLRLARS
jgi:hypothetical protein